jgi:hypothetical protein
MLKSKLIIFFLLLIIANVVWSQNIRLTGTDICSDGTLTTEIRLSDADPDAFYALFCDEQRLSLRQISSGIKPNPINFGEFSQPGVYTVVQYPNNSNDMNNPNKGTLISGKVHIKPVPKIFIPNEPMQVKSGETFIYRPKADMSDATFTWTASVAEGKLKKFETNGNGNIALNFEIIGEKSAKVIFSITPVAPDFKGGCMGTTHDLTLWVLPVVN